MKKYKILIVMLLALSNSLFAQVNYTANDQVTPYNGKFRAAVNPGYYGGDWDVFDLTDISASNNASANPIGVGVKAIRGTLPEHYGIVWDYNNWTPMYEYYQALGIEDNTLVVGVAHPDHRDPVDYCPNDPTQTTMFANLYEPIWDGGANGTPINENNYMAKYVYDLVNTVGDHVKFWEVWNEPGYDLTGYKSSLQPGQPGNWWENDPDPCDIILRAPIQNYIRTMRITYEVIKTMSPDDYVVLSGIGTDAFLDALMRNTDNPNGGAVTPEFPHTAGAYFDVVGFHAYPHFDGSVQHWDNNIGGMVFTRHSDGAVEGFAERVQNRKDLLTTYGYGAQYPAKLLIVTEYGVPRQQFEGYFGSEELQKAYYMKILAESSKLKITQTGAWQLAERKSTPTNSFDVMGFYKGIENSLPDEEIKLPAGVAHATASMLLDGGVFSQAETNNLNLPAGVKGYAFQKSNGTYVYMLWARTNTDMSEAANATYSFPSSYGGSMDMRSWNFSETNNTQTTSSQGIALNAIPKFFTKPTAKGNLSLNCPSGKIIEVPAPEADGGAIVNWTAPNAATTCPGGATVTSTGGVSGGFYPFGVTVVGYKAVDACGNEQRCAIRVAVSSTGGLNTTCRIALWDFKFAGQRNGHKYFISKFEKTYQEAVAVAASYGAKLLSIETQAENDFLRYQYTDLGYIGLTDAQSEGNLMWASGAPVTYNVEDNCSWCLPNNAANDFAEYHPWSASWSYTDGTEPKFFMMEFDCGEAPSTNISVTSFPTNIEMTVSAGQTVSWAQPTATTTCQGVVNITQNSGPTSGSYIALDGVTHTVSYSFTDNCGNSITKSFTIKLLPQSGGGCPASINGFTVLGELNGHKYFLSNNANNWNANKLMAEQNGGYLAVVNTAEENTFLKNAISEMVHFGLNDIANEGTLSWVNGEAMTYTNISSCSWCGINSAANDFGLLLPWDGTWSFDNPWGSRKMILEMDCQNSGGGELTVSNCPTNKEVTANGSGQAILSWIPPTASTTCNPNTVSTSQTGPAQGSTWNINSGPASISYTFTDNCGNTQSCSFTITLVPRNTNSCPTTINGFTTLGEFNGHKYYVSNSTNNWATNKAAAEANGGYLAVINDAAENSFIKNTINDIVHIGFTDGSSEGQPAWVNGNAMSYTNYSNCDWCGLNTADNDFGVMLFWDGKWSFDHQWASRKFVMEMECGSGPNPECPTSMAGHEYLGLHGGHAYFLSENMSNWPEAANLAEAQGGYIATINNAAENEFIRANINSYVLIGLNDASTEGQLTWKNGEAFSYDNLDGTNSGQADYGVMNFWNGGWSMVNQYVRKKYLVEVSCPNAQVVLPQTQARIETLYPTPANDLITIQVISKKERAAIYNIYDGVGRLMLSQNSDLPKGSSEITIDVSTLPAGMYFVKGEGEVTYRKFVIMR